MLNEQNYTNTVKNMRKSAVRLERQGDYWSEEDKENLSKMFFEGVGITEMAVILQRSETAIIQQIEKMNLVLPTDCIRLGRRAALRSLSAYAAPAWRIRRCVPSAEAARCCQEGE